MERLDTCSSIYDITKRTFGNFRVYEPKVAEIHRSMSITFEGKDLLSRLSAKHRGNVKRMIKKIESLDHEYVSNRDVNWKELLEASASISHKTYQHALGVGFRNDQRYVHILWQANDCGWLDLRILKIRNAACAFQFGLRYNNTYYLHSIGFDPDYKVMNVGTVLFFHVYSDLREHGFEKIDFGFGEADYKKSYGTECYYESSLYIFSSSVKSTLVNIIGKLISLVSKLSLEIVQRLKLAAYIKRLWRGAACARVTI
jgi:hypothetical protein